MLRRPAGDQVHARIRGLVRRKVAEDPDAALPFHELRNGGLERVAEFPRIVRNHDLDDAIGVGIGKRAEQQRVDDRKDGGVRADADGEDGDRGDGEPARPAEEQPGVADVARDVLEESAHKAYRSFAGRPGPTTTTPSFITHRTPVTTSLMFSNGLP